MTLDEIRACNMRDALETCGQLDNGSLTSLINTCASNDHRPLLALKVARDWIIPDDLSNGITPLTSNAERNGSIGDFGEARNFILRQRTKAPNDPRAPKAKAASWDHWFYPEYKSCPRAHVS